MLLLVNKYICITFCLCTQKDTPFLICKYIINVRNTKKEFENICHKY